MVVKMFNNDTIAAIATSIGEGGIGVIRISGTNAKEIGLKVLKNKKNQTYMDFKTRQVYYGKVIDYQSGAILDEVLFFYSPEPRSFTAENTLEIQAHGGVYILGKILASVLSAGARMAEPGEFSKRAFLNGRIDLMQAESIIDLIRAKTDKAQQLALSQLTGRTSAGIFQLEAEIYEILVKIEAVLDFPEEGLPEIVRQDFSSKIKNLSLKIAQLLSDYDQGRKIREGITIVIIGQPNVGKSSLLNWFLEEERAIVTDIPGTTRDLIEAQIQLSGIPVRLIDTAGIRETDNPIEQIGINKAKQALLEADLILWLLDISQPLTEADLSLAKQFEAQKGLIILNKTDLPRKLDQTNLNEIVDWPVFETSLVNRIGLEELEQEICTQVGIGKLQVDERPLLSRIRHKQALQKAQMALESFQAALELQLSEDLLAIDLREALTALAEITGKNVTTEIIDGIFSQFCIGK